MPSAAGTARASRSPTFASAMSGHLNALEAGRQVSRSVNEQLGGGGALCDVAILFVSAQHLNETREIAELVRTEIRARVFVCVTTESVLEGETELERQAGVALFAASMPGVHIYPFKTDALSPIREGNLNDVENFAREAGMGATRFGRYRGTLLFVDPFSVPINAMLPAFSTARSHAVKAQDNVAGRDEYAPMPPVIGGLLSASTKADQNYVILNDQVRRSGGIGLSFSGDIRIDALVSQGCRPIGQPWVITAGKGQLITSLGGRPALKVLAELLDSLDDATKEQVRKGLFVGRAISEYKERFGRDDFLIRNLIGIDQSAAGKSAGKRKKDLAKEEESESVYKDSAQLEEEARRKGPEGALAVGDFFKVGQTIQFHVRDAKTADEDLALLLDAQQLKEPAKAALLFTCTGRGTRLFPKANHDAATIRRALAAVDDPARVAGGAALSSKGGEVFAPAETHLPLAGMFCMGEIGPVGDGVFVHGQAACAAIFRKP